jgi:hypothetical protein
MGCAIMGCTRRRSGTVNLFGRGRLDSRGWASNVGDLYRNGSAAANFRPHPKCLHPGSSVFGGSDVITPEMEKVVDLIVSCDETLSLAGRFELLHLPLSSSRRLVGIFHQIQDFWHRKRQYRANRVARAPFTFVSLHDAFLLQLADCRPLSMRAYPLGPHHCTRASKGRFQLSSLALCAAEGESIELVLAADEPPPAVA